RFSANALVLSKPGESLDVNCTAPSNFPPGRYAIRLVYVERGRPEGELPPEADRLALGGVESDEIVFDHPGSTIDRWLSGSTDEAVTRVLESLQGPACEDALLDALRTLARSDRLGYVDRARVRAGVLAALDGPAGRSAPDVAMEVLYLVADESCAPNFEA